MKKIILMCFLVSCGANIKGKDGEPGKPGPQGIQGESGEQGEIGVQGPAGRDGQDGSHITPVIPCPDDTRSYPEVLLCIDNQLYAVYDQEPNKVRYVQVSPGTYTTTDGRSCTFTVADGCNIK